MAGEPRARRWAALEGQLGPTGTPGAGGDEWVPASGSERQMLEILPKMKGLLCGFWWFEVF